MPETGFCFQVHHVDARTGARRSSLHTPHGLVQMPVFMPVGSQGTVKGIELSLLQATGTQMILANAYHLMLRPGVEVVAALGGLHRFCGWPGPILTDSGGFQIYSLAQRTQITEQAAWFRSHIDGRAWELSPEEAIRIQEALGSDIAMVLDHVVGLPSPPELVQEAAYRTVRWAQRCKQAACRSDQALFGIIQGGLDVKLRLECLARLVELDFDGYAIGGLSVGETPEQMRQVLQVVVPAMPADKPRYLMGVGRPEDILDAIALGVDMFDCVLPTRNGRNGWAFTDHGVIRIRNHQYERDERPLEEGCQCPACQRSRGYLRHLFLSGEMLGPVLLSLHNIWYYQRLIGQARQAIEQDRFLEFCLEKKRHWQKEADWEKQTYSEK
ncbi:MAG: tRNA guanosine(34) transglycosylase Tgt [Thermoguttaceae bacterium]|nr:tRNA guanosine(34) transglycosylase Tgt [Thermoguttaceae bacterium]MDW8037944.1 tRNA guanosine(34) transglycosylase Tgt [Thermoguttaceae bacterium]